jgi:hypothetical protein
MPLPRPPSVLQARAARERYRRAQRTAGAGVRYRASFVRPDDRAVRGPAYLTKFETQRDIGDLVAHEFVALVAGDGIRWFPPLQALSASLRVPGVQVNSILALVASLQGAMGIGELPTYIGDGIPDLVRVLPDVESAYDVWLGMRADFHRTARVRVVERHAYPRQE